MATGCAGDQKPLQGPCPGIHLTDHLQLAGTTCSMATGCAGDQERLQRPCPGIRLTDHLQLAGTTCSMATGCAGDQEPLQRPCPSIPRPITGSWPARRLDGHRLRR